MFGSSRNLFGISGVERVSLAILESGMNRAPISLRYFKNHTTQSKDHLSLIQNNCILGSALLSVAFEPFVRSFGQLLLLGGRSLRLLENTQNFAYLQYKN